jgi:hypothetical protein
MAESTIPQSTALIGVGVFIGVIALLFIALAIQHRGRNLAYIVGSAFSITILAIFMILAAMKWPGEANGCLIRPIPVGQGPNPAATPDPQVTPDPRDFNIPAGAPVYLPDPPDTCYCENSPYIIRQEGQVKQPINTLSSFAPMIAGLMLLALVDADRRRFTATTPEPATPMHTVSFLSVFYGVLVIFLGPGAMFFHASMTRFGGAFDQFSMVLLMDFIVFYNIFHLSGAVRSQWVKQNFLDYRLIFCILYALLNGFLFMVAYADAEGSTGTMMFGISVGIVILVELIIVIFHPGGVSRDWQLLTITLLVFMVAMFVWDWSKTGGPLCDPGRAFQGHAFWHVLAMAVAPFLIFKYLRTETRD